MIQTWNPKIFYCNCLSYSLSALYSYISKVKGSIVWHLYSQKALYYDSSKVKGFYIDIGMVWRLYSPTSLLFVRQPNTSRTLYFDSSTAWHLCIPTSLYSDSSIVRGMYSVTALTDAKIKELNLLDTLLAYMNIVDQIQVFLLLTTRLLWVVWLRWVLIIVNRAMGF